MLGIIFPDGELWKEQRRFAVRTLKELGVGKNSLSHCIEQETGEMIAHLNELITTEKVTLRMDDFFDLPCLNVIWSLGKPFLEKNLKKKHLFGV